MQSNAQAFNTHLAGIGQQYLWRRSFDCPCVSAGSGAAKPGCPQCGGRGCFWLAAVAGVAGMAGSKTQAQWAQSGQYEGGDIVLTIPENTPLYEMGQFDRVVAVNNTDRFSIVLTRGANDVLRGPIERIERVFWLDDVGAIVEGGIPTVSSTGVLTWSSGEPPAKKTYSINGWRKAEFFCFGEFPSDRNMHSGMRLPKRVVLRKFDLFSRSGKV